MPKPGQQHEQQNSGALDQLTCPPSLGHAFVHPSDTHSARLTRSLRLPRAKEMDEATDADGDAGAVSSSTSSSLSSGEEGVFQDQQLGGHAAPASSLAAADVAQPVPRGRRLWATARAAAPSRLREACENAARDLVAWTRRGGAPRSLLVVSVGSVALVVLTGLLILVVFVVAATTNAIAFSVVVSMAAAGGFLAVLLAFLAAIYIGAVSVAVFVISVTTIATVIAITIATGWVAFFWFLWFAARECLNLATKRRTGTTRSMI